MFRQFLSTLSLRRATYSGWPQGPHNKFLSTLSLRRATGGFHKINCQLMVFLSTLSLRRATWYPQPGRHLGSDFYPRSPCGERPALSGGTLSDVDFYPRSPCGERRLAHETYVVMEAFLSTLSLRRATKYVYVWYTILVNFYPRSPCGERLPEEDMILEEQIISIHALLAESDKTYYWIHKPSLYISIHALLAESDFGPILAGFIGGLFLSTLSLRRAT